MVPVPILLRALPPDAAVYITAATEGAPDPASPLVQFGAIGAVAAAALAFFTAAYKREAARADRLETRIDEMHRANIERVIPALLSATEVIRDSQQLVREMAARDRDR